MRRHCLRVHRILLLTLGVIFCSLSAALCFDFANIKECDFGLSCKQPVAIGETAYKAGIFSRCLECEEDKEPIIYDYIYQGIENGSATFKIRPVSSTAIEKFARVGDERMTYNILLNDMGCGMGELEFEKLFVCVVGEKYDIYFKKIFLPGQNMGFVHYKEEFKQYLSDNHIVVTEGKEIGSFTYELVSCDKNKIEIKESWFFYGLSQGDFPHRMITIPLDNDGNAVFTMADGKKYHLTLVEDQNIWHPSVLVADRDGEFARFWKQRKFIKIPVPAGKDAPVMEPRPSSAIMDTDAWKPFVRKSKGFEGKIYFGSGEYFSTVNKRQTGSFGELLVDGRGRPVYTYAKDASGVSNCSGECLGRQWKPLLVRGEPSLEPEIPGEIALIERNKDLDPFSADFMRFQVLYNGMPLYQYDKDTPEEDPQGEGMDDLWHVVRVEPFQQLKGADDEK